MPIAVESLKGIPYFARLSRPDLERIRGLVFEQSFSKGQILFLEGDPCRAMYAIRSGRVKIFKTSPEGKEQVLKIIGPGETFNEVPIFDGGPNPASAQALEETTLYGLRKEDMRSLIEERPTIALAVLQVFAEKLRYFTRLVEDLSFRTVISRLAKLLFQMAEEQGSAPLRQRLTQQELAAMVGTAREVVARALKALEAKGAIRMDRHRIVIVDKGVLQRMIEGGRRPAGPSPGSAAL